MRFAYLPAALLLLTASIAQSQSTGSAKSPSAQTQTTGTSSTKTPVQDPQAVVVLNQAVAASGGTQAINGVMDYTATGNIAIDSGTEVRGTVNIQALISTGGFRMDATLPAGVQSWAVDNGVVSTKSTTGKISSVQANINVPTSNAVPYRPPLLPTSLLFPALPLGSAIDSPNYGISYGGVKQVDGHSVQDIQLQITFPSGTGHTPVQTRELFIDSTTFQIVMMRDVLPKGLLQETHFSNYQPVGELLMPFAITQDVQGQHTGQLSVRQIWSMQLNQITFNTGLQESAFSLQQ